MFNFFFNFLIFQRVTSVLAINRENNDGINIFSKYNYF